MITVASGSNANFGTITVFESGGPNRLRIRNDSAAGQGGTTVSAPAVATTGPYTVDTNNCVTIAPQGSCDVFVAFQPTIVGNNQVGTLTVGSGPAGTATWNLTGNARSEAALAWDSAVTDFGYATIATTGLSRTFTLRNTGDTPTAAAPTFGLSGSTTQYTVNTTGCTAGVLAANSSCNITVTFNPTSVGVKPMVITASANGAVATGLSAQLTGITGEGRAAVAGTVNISPRFHNYGFTVSGASGPIQTFTVTNNTAATVNNVQFSVTPATDFTIDDSVTPCIGTNLTAGNSCNFQVRFTPVTAGQKSAVVTATTSGGNDSATLFGNAGQPADLALTGGDSAAFGPIVVGLDDFRSFDFTNQGEQNTGSIAVSITGLSAGQFSVWSNGCNFVAAGATCSVGVRFNPSAIAAGYTATLNLVPTNGTGETVTLTGDGVLAPDLVLTPAGPVDCGATVPAQSSVNCATFTLSNPGGVLTGWDWDRVNGAPFVLELDNDDEFNILSTTCALDTFFGDAFYKYAPIAANSSCTIIVSYSPDNIDASESDTLNAYDWWFLSDDTDLTGGSVSALSTPASAAAQTFSAAVGASTSQTFTYTNATGTPASAPLFVTLTNSANNEYATMGTCSGAILAPGGTCTVTVTFTPITIATGKTGTLVVRDPTNVNKVAATVNLTGAGTP
jgi:hypothetical protein